MREIKFRAWHKVNKFMQEDLIVNVIVVFSNIEYWELMQFTGLKDMRGNDIYEGDIIDFIYNPKCLNKNFRGVVELDECYHSIIRVNNVPADWGCRGIFHIENAMNGEVIGNIYENPELLNEVGNETDNKKD